MACTIASGRTTPCNENVGGLKNIYIINYGTLGTPTNSATGITNFSLASTAYKFELLNGSSFEETITSDRAAGTSFYEQTLTLNLNSIDNATTAQVEALVKGQPHIIIEDNNGKMWVAGMKYGMDVTGGTITRGTAMGDKSGYEVTFQGMEKIAAGFIEQGDNAVATLSGVNITISA